MYDKGLVIGILQQTQQACQTILQRFAPVTAVDQFTNSPGGMEKLDSICMLLIAIGESLKNLDKVTEGNLLPLYPQVEWTKAKGMRDFICHHYFEVDAEVVFHTCDHHIKALEETLGVILTDINTKD